MLVSSFEIQRESSSRLIGETRGCSRTKTGNNCEIRGREEKSIRCRQLVRFAFVATTPTKSVKIYTEYFSKDSEQKICCWRLRGWHNCRVNGDWEDQRRDWVSSEQEWNYHILVKNSTLNRSNTTHICEWFNSYTLTKFVPHY